MTNEKTNKKLFNLFNKTRKFILYPKNISKLAIFLWFILT